MNGFDSIARVYSAEGNSPAFTSMGGGGRQPKIEEKADGKFLKDGKAYRVRKLTEKECLRLMGVKDDDSERIMKHQSRSSTYYMAGNSICTTCIVALIGEMIADVDWKTKIREIADDVAKEMRSNDCENV